MSRKRAVKAVKLPRRTYSPMPTSNVTMEENREGRDSPCWIKGPGEWESEHSLWVWPSRFPHCQGRPFRMPGQEKLGSMVDKWLLYVSHSALFPKCLSCIFLDHCLLRVGCLESGNWWFSFHSIKMKITGGSRFKPDEDFLLSRDPRLWAGCRNLLGLRVGFLGRATMGSIYGRKGETNT